VLGLVLAGAVWAQEPLGIVAVVNDDVISARDLDRRLDLIVRSAGVADTPDARQRLREQALQSLVNERLQMQEAARQKIEVTEEELDSARRAVERQNNLPPGSFDDFIRSRSLDSGAVLAQIRAEIAWGKLVRQRLMPSVSISKDEIDAAVARIENAKGQTEYLLAEIVFIVDNPEQEDDARRAAERVLEQLSAGASFPAMARQFSHGVSAGAGGDIGWVRAEALPNELEAVVRKMPPGSVSTPIRTQSGFYILALRDTRQFTGLDLDETKLTLMQVVLPLAPEASASEVERQTIEAGKIAQSIKSCADVETLQQNKKDFDAGSLGTLRLGDLPKDFRQALAEADAGHVTAPLRSPGGLHVLAVCQRQEPPSDISARKIRNNLMNTKVSMLARRYLRDLRRDALIEVR
jgi:peptidyl-prolyl cis-trans isomerase SurA